MINKSFWLTIKTFFSNLHILIICVFLLSFYSLLCSDFAFVARSDLFWILGFYLLVQWAWCYCLLFSFAQFFFNFKSRLWIFELSLEIGLVTKDFPYCQGLVFKILKWWWKASVFFREIFDVILDSFFCQCHSDFYWLLPLLSS